MILFSALGWGMALAEDAFFSSKPALTAPERVAMVFYRLTGQYPDFQSLAAREKGAEAQQLRDVYNLMMPYEPILVETPAKLSAYSAAHGGFFIENFKMDTYFPVRYAGSAYALVPRGIVDKQWLGVPDAAQAAAIEAAAAKSAGRLLTMVLRLSPKSADKAAPVRLGGEDYWPISVTVEKMMLFPPDGDALLWRSDAGEPQDKKREELLKFYR